MSLFISTSVDNEPFVVVFSITIPPVVPGFVVACSVVESFVAGLFVSGDCVVTGSGVGAFVAALSFVGNFVMTPSVVVTASVVAGLVMGSIVVAYSVVIAFAATDSVEGLFVVAVAPDVIASVSTGSVLFVASSVMRSPEDTAVVTGLAVVGLAVTGLAVTGSEGVTLHFVRAFSWNGPQRLPIFGTICCCTLEQLQLSRS